MVSEKYINNLSKLSEVHSSIIQQAKEGSKSALSDARRLRIAELRAAGQHDKANKFEKIASGQ